MSRGQSFCGMVIAIYPGEPVALFMTAEDLLTDMDVLFPEIRLPIASKLSQDAGDITITQDREGHEVQSKAPQKQKDMKQLPDPSTSKSSGRSRLENTPAQGSRSSHSRAEMSGGGSGGGETSVQDTRSSNFRGDKRGGGRILVWTCVSILLEIPLIRSHDPSTKC